MLYVNGAPVSSPATHDSRSLYSDPSSCMATPDIPAPALLLNAIIDDVAIYDRAINAAEVQELCMADIPCSGCHRAGQRQHSKKIRID